MIILQDLVHLHSEKKTKTIPTGLDLELNDRSSTHLELILIGIGALVLLAVSVISSIPDKERQEELKNIDMGREIAAEPCDMNLNRVDIAQTGSDEAVHRICVY